MVGELLLVFTALLLLWWFTRTPQNFPPGPPNWSVIGSFPYLKGKYLHLTLHGLAERYGPLVGLKLGLAFNAVSVSGPLVMEALRREEFQGRNRTVRGQVPRPGIIFKDGEHWREQRRFALRHLRDLGLGKSSMEGMISEEANEFFRERFEGKTKVQVAGLFGTSSINILWGIMAGRRFSYDDKEFAELQELLAETFRTDNVSLGFLRSLGFVRRLLPRWSGALQQHRLETRMNDFLQRQLEDHRRALTAAPRDFIDIYLKELERSERAKSFTETTLRAVCLDLFTAGAESISNTLSFCILYMVLYPAWQERMHREIVAVLGRGAVSPSLADRDRLPSVQAFLSEVTRANSIAPINVPRRCTRDAVLGGYCIPKDTFLFINIWSVLNDEEHWGDPGVFRPGRFLNGDGSYRKDDWMVNFGAGARACIGESLSKSFLFVFLTVMVAGYSFELAAGEQQPSEEPAAGITLSPKPFHFQPVPRQRK